MIWVLLGLALVAATALIYTGMTAATDRDDVARRQFDVWAAVFGLLCATLIVYGADDVQRQSAEATSQRAITAAEAPSAVVRRRLRHDLRTNAVRPSVVPPTLDLAVASSPPVVSAARPTAPVAPPPPRPVESSAEREAEAAAVVVALEARMAAATATPEPRLAPVSVGRSDGEREVEVATATPVLIASSRATATALPPLVPISPVLPPATEAAPPAPTPHCGDPAAIDLGVELVSAEAERDDGGELVVRYEARLDNRADFPVQLTSLRVTALNRTGGSEQYGVDMRPDLTLPAVDALRFSGAVALRKNPGPFGRTEVCISFVPETCGHRLPPNQRIMTRCRSVNGF